MLADEPQPIFLRDNGEWWVTTPDKTRELKAKLDPEILEVLDDSYGVCRLYEEVRAHRASEEQDNKREKKKSKSLAGRVRDGHCDPYGYPHYTYYFRGRALGPIPGSITDQDPRGGMNPFVWVDL